MYDSVLMAANFLYTTNEVKHVRQGEQCRSALSTYLTVLIVLLYTLFQNVKILEAGAGHQTYSLKLETLFSLRSLTKDSHSVIPKTARTLGLENIVVDGFSAKHSYAALAVSQLSKKAKIFSTRSKSVYLSKQEKL